MKTLKKVLCILLSSMILLFAGACNQGNNAGAGASQEKDPGEKQYFLSTKDENVDIEVTTDKTNAYGEQDTIKVTVTMTVKKKFGPVGGRGWSYEEFLYSVAYSTDPVFPSKYFSPFSLEDYGNSSDVLMAYPYYSRSGTQQAPWLPIFEEGLVVTRTFEYRRQIGKDVKINPKGEYRIYFYMRDIADIFYLFIPTDIVLNMQ